MPFTGEQMTCILCNRTETSDPTVESNWRSLQLDDRRFYACPDEFPADGSSKDAFKEAYLKVILACINAVQIP